MVDLLDVNVWVALSIDGHVHHPRSVEFISNEASEHVGLCRTTELALLRLLSNRSVLGDRALDSGSAWNALQTLAASPRVVRLEEPPALDEVLGSWASTVDMRGSDWTDGYLAAFATANGNRLVSFDSDFERYPGLSWLHLEP